MIDLDNPSLLVMTEFELLATVAAFAAVLAMAVWDGFRIYRTGKRRAGSDRDQ